MGRRVRYKPTHPGHKVCTRCLQEKMCDEFPPNKNTKDHLGSWCRNCLRIVTTAWYHDNLDRERARMKAYRETRKQSDTK